VILFHYLNWIGLIAPILIVTLIFIQNKVNSRFQIFVKRKLKLAEVRSKKIDELVNGIKLVKFRAWEVLIYDQLDKIRKDETALSFKIFTSFGLSYLQVTLIPMLCAIISIWLYGVVYGKLESSQIFALLALFTNIIHPVRLWIFTMFIYIEASMSCNRVSNYCKLPERDQFLDESQLNERAKSVSRGGIVVRNGSIQWKNEKIHAIMTDLI
jgi:ABC-type bacteriocin/lantibiotic exporter with double-glycine peptidase domain